MSTFIKKNSKYSEINSFYKKVNNVWTQITENEFLSYLGTTVCEFKNKNISHLFEIAAPPVLVAETCQCIVLLNDATITSGVSWSVASGSTYASIDNSGLLTVNSNASSSSIILQATYSGFSATHSMTVTYKSGSVSETTTETSVNESGMTVTTTTTITENEDGTTSSTSTIITYNDDGNPTEKTNQEIDVSGNIDTQDIVYDETTGEEIVVGYSIDTSNNPDGEKNFNAEGVNTEYYAFDLTHGFVLNIHFSMDYGAQPTGQNENHHNILTMKRANPSPWYGFQLRQTSTNRYIILGTQFATGSNTNTNVSGTSMPGTSLYEFSFTITYNPTASTNTFVCRDNMKNKNIFTSNLKFPDIEELKYLKVTVGCALSPQGVPYRFSNINVYDFNITRT